MKFHFVFIILLTVNVMFAQPGKDGAQTVSGNNVLNKYSPVTSNINAGSSSISVLAQSNSLGLCPGDLIMVYQAQGATISSTNNIGYGAITAYNNAGLYEFVYVQSVNANVITTASNLLNNYTVGGMTQVIKVPQYTTLTVNAGANVISKAWKDTIVSSVIYRMGGIVCIHAANIINNGTIHTNGAGFRGGQLDMINQSQYTNNITGYVSNINYYGGEKGEGIAGYQPEYDLLGGRYGRGAPANGGGGGNAWNSGGGGGANANNNNAWTGQGIMIVDAFNPLAAWQLDPGYVANANSLTNSSGGGRGGYSNSYQNQNATVTPLGDPLWWLDNRHEVGGLGGRPLTNINYTNRIYMGGGGGAGDENDGNSSNGGSGGGIIYLIATNAISGTGIISSNGSNGGNTVGNGYDGPSGAGAGGSIVILSTVISSNQNIQANGGDGGNQFILNSEAEGPGGGGGGGFVALSTPAVIASVTGGINGNTNSSSLTEFPSNGATTGAAGQTVPANNSFISFNASAILNASSNAPICAGNVLNLSAGTINGAVYSWMGPNSYSAGQQNPSIVNAQQNMSGAYIVSASLPGCMAITNTVNVIVNPGVNLSVTSSTLICQGQGAVLSASGASNYLWSNGSTSSSISVSPASSTNYTVTGSSAGCGSASAIITVQVSDCTGIDEQNEKENLVNIYPVPASGNITVELSTNNVFDLVVYNTVGQVILNQKNNQGRAVIDSKNYSPGLYFAVISVNSASILKRIIIE